MPKIKNALDKPILLFGMPRSGTTWIGKIVDSHPFVLYRHEPDSINRIEFLPHFPLVNDCPNQVDAIADYWQKVPQQNAAKVSGKRPLFKKRFYGAVAHGLIVISLYAGALANRLVSSYKPKTYLPISNKSKFRLAWKSIESLARLPWFAKHFPDSLCVHIIRHPAGYIASVLKGEAKTVFAENTRSSEDYEQFKLLLETPVAKSYQLTMDELKSMTNVERLAWRWLIYNEFVLSQSADLKNVYPLFYDEFCAEPLESAKSLFEFCQLDWNEQSEAFVRQSTEQNEAAYYSVFKSPEKAANQWRTQLSEEQQQQIRQVIQRSEKLWSMVADKF